MAKIHAFPSQSFGIRVSKNYIGNPSLFQKTSGSETLLCLILSKFFCTTVSKFFFGHPSLCKKTSGNETFLRMRGRCHVFPSNCFCFRIPEIFIRNSSVFQKFLGMGRTIWTRWGVSLISVHFVCLILPKKFHWVFHKNSGSEKIPCLKERCITFFRRYFSVSQFRKLSLGTPACFKKILSAKTIFGSEVRGISRFTVEILLSHITEKFY